MSTIAACLWPRRPDTPSFHACSAAPWCAGTECLAGLGTDQSIRGLPRGAKTRRDLIRGAPPRAADLSGKDHEHVASSERLFGLAIGLPGAVLSERTARSRSWESA